jgi:hypothetical protein
VAHRRLTTLLQRDAAPVVVLMSLKSIVWGRAPEREALCAPEVGMEVAAALGILKALAFFWRSQGFESPMSRAPSRHDDMYIG